MIRHINTGLFAVFGLLSLLNAAIMLSAPEWWFWTTPGVSGSGPYNPHFVKDVGLTFLVLGVAAGAALAVPQYRLPLLGVFVAWNFGHAVLHVVDIATGCLPPENIATDTPLVIVPAFIAALLLIIEIANRRAST